MATEVPEDVLDGLASFDTPSITNVVATYPDDPLCLGLYNPWRENWYTDETVECMYPDLGPRVGHAVTCVYGMPDPAFDELGFMDVAEAIDAAPEPSILAMEQDFPDDVAASVGLTGGNMTTTMRTLGAVGCVSNGPGRDVEEVRPKEFQYLLTGTAPGHGDIAVQAVNVPVSIRGMDVAPGELIHMDANGAVKFPADRASEVLTNVRKLEEREADLQAALRDADGIEDVRAAFGGEGYGEE